MIRLRSCTLTQRAHRWRYQETYFRYEHLDVYYCTQCLAKVEVCSNRMTSVTLSPDQESNPA